MSELEFWRLLALIDTASLDSGNEAAALLPLEVQLATKTEAELFGFEELLSQALFALDGQAYAANAGESGGSDDGFLYARCYVVAKGREHFEAVKANAPRMPKSVEQWCESLLYGHRAAWAHNAERSQSDWPFSATVSFETGSNSKLWSA